jgi:hypothetical protein
VALACAHAAHAGDLGEAEMQFVGMLIAGICCITIQLWIIKVDVGAWTGLIGHYASILILMVMGWVTLLPLLW